MNLKAELRKYYTEFRGLPSGNPIVRNNQENDAFEIFIYDLLFRNFSTELKKSDIKELSSKIVPPPDEGIDIFHELSDGDEFKYSIVQVKNSALTESEIKSCFDKMKRTIELFYKDRKKVNKNLREIISKTNFDEDNQNNIEYYVVHSGVTSSIVGQKDDEIILNIHEIETLFNGIKSKSVPSYEFVIKGNNSFLTYQSGKSNKKSLICSLKASEIAPLVKKYDNTELGRNILFGQNLREAIKKGSKTYDGIKETITNEPHNFWYYNNGITIIAKKLIIENDKINLKQFSIINGAQTTSSFLQFLHEIERDYKKKDQIKMVKKLEEVHILTRIVETQDDNEFKNKITLFNNTQNPISTRDMVSNNPEQISLQKKFLNSKPAIFIDIRRGALKPTGITFDKHRIVTNTELAQFLNASILQKPFNAKNNKSTIFNKDKNSRLINEQYDEIFYPNDGVAFKISSNILDEILFIKELHKKCKKYISDRYNDDIDDLKLKIKAEKDKDEKASLEEQVRIYQKLKTINNVSMFYNITLYYFFKKTYDTRLKAESKLFNFDRFYSKGDTYYIELVSNFANLFNMISIQIIKELANDNPPAFVRAKPSEKLFLEALKDKLQTDLTLKEKYTKFVKEFKF
jgi:hypothetical protein